MGNGSCSPGYSPAAACRKGDVDFRVGVSDAREPVIKLVTINVIVIDLNETKAD